MASGEANESSFRKNSTASSTSNGHATRNIVPDGHRNFRCKYIESLGVKGTDVPNALDQILHVTSSPEKVLHIDLNRLRNVVSQFVLPFAYRERVWMLLLAMLPPVSQVDDFIVIEHKKLSADLERCLAVLNLQYKEEDMIDYSTEDLDGLPDSRAKNLALMHLLESGQLDLSKTSDQLLQVESASRFSRMAHVITELQHALNHDYWLLKEFLQYIDSLNSADIALRVLNELSTEEAALYRHLEGIEFSLAISNLPSSDKRSSSGDSSTSSVDGSLTSKNNSPGIASHAVIPFYLWLLTCFAGYVAASSLIKIWDRVITSSSFAIKILSILAKNLIKLHKKDIMATKEAKQIRQILLKVSLFFSTVCPESNLLYFEQQPLPNSQSEQLVNKVLEDSWEPI